MGWILSIEGKETQESTVSGPVTSAQRFHERQRPRQRSGQAPPHKDDLPLLGPHKDDLPLLGPHKDDLASFGPRPCHSDLV